MALVSIHSSGICSIYGRHLFTRILFWRRLGRHGCATGTRYMIFEMHVRPDVQVYECRPKLFCRVALSTLSFPAPSMTPALFSHICIGWCTQHTSALASATAIPLGILGRGFFFFGRAMEYRATPRNSNYNHRPSHRPLPSAFMTNIRKCDWINRTEST